MVFALFGNNLLKRFWASSSFFFSAVLLLQMPLRCSHHHLWSVGLVYRHTLEWFKDNLINENQDGSRLFHIYWMLLLECLLLYTPRRNNYIEISKKNAKKWHKIFVLLLYASWNWAEKNIIVVPAPSREVRNNSHSSKFFNVQWNSISIQPSEYSTNFPIILNKTPVQTIIIYTKKKLLNRLRYLFENNKHRSTFNEK